MVILEPFGGLANRMRVIASGIWLKEKLKTALIVFWNENYELNCPYNLLFEEDELISVRHKERKYNYVRSSNQPSAAKTISANIVNKIIGVNYCIREPDFHSLVWAGKLDIYEAARKNKVTNIQTCQEFGDNLFAFKYFRPVLPLMEKIRLVTGSFTPFTIGVHIRRTDHTNAIQFSPLELFIAKMQQELDAQVNTTFFLCTDEPEAEQTIKAIFGAKVITYKKELSRMTVQGIQDAVVDLYCLAATKKILGSYWSSFSDIASRLNNIELEVLKTSG
jgi:hypothetical protein